MAELRFTEAFAKYGAKLANPMWSFSAIAADGSLVLSCWQHKFSIPEKGVLRYSDKLSRWHRENHLGKKMLTEHLSQAHQHQLPVRLIVATTTEPERVDAGEDASRIGKTFHLKEDFVGQVVSFDGDAYEIDFRKAPKCM
jgi:hypothetical protein